MKYDYDIAIIGGGSGGLSAASSTAQLGLKVLLIDNDRLGGDCLWHGCVPSKSLIAVGKKIHTVRRLSDFGLPSVKEFTPQFGSIMQRMRDVQAAIQPNDSPERFKKLGADVQFGSPSFIDSHTLFLNDKKLTFKYAIIATGSSPRVPDIPGLKEAGYLTNVDAFQLKKLPKRLVIVGGGPIGVELAQTFQRFGSSVTVLVRSKLLAKEDQELAAMLQKKLEGEGVTFVFDKRLSRVDMKEGAKVLTLEKETVITCDAVLVAVGRQPNIEELHLEQAGIKHNERGIVVDQYLRTTVKHIYAIGDVTGGLQFTHMAGSHAATAVRNIITPILKTKAESKIVPWVTFSDPEFARVGMLVSDDTLQFLFDFKENDRAIAEEELTGQVRVVATPKGKILGASILGPNAGELIMEYVLAMKHNLSVKDIAGTIHPYPTLSGANQSATGAYYKRLLTEKTKKIVQFLVRKL